MSRIQAITHEFRRPLSRRNNTDTIVFHHQAGNEVDAATIHGWHRNRKTNSGRYWAGIGYHYIIMRDGVIQTGRPDWAYGAHAGAGANGSSIGVMVTGNLEVQEPTAAQMDSAVWLVREVLIPRYGKLAITGHRDHMATSCPGRHFPMEELKGRIIEEEVIKMVSKYFKDIRQPWQAEAVDSLRGKGIVSGRTESTFDPDSPITRAECAVLIHKTMEYLKDGGQDG